MTGTRKALAGLFVAAALGLLAEGVTRLFTGPPEVPVVVRMPDGSEGLWAEEGGVVTPRLREHAEWWPADNDDPRPRVVLLGGSSLAGPPADRSLMAWVLAEQLDVEVVNLGVGGMDTAHLLAAVPGVVALQPDAVVIYTGHNDLGNAVFSQRFAAPGAVAIARLRQLLGHSRIFGLLEASWRGREERQVVVQWDTADMALGPTEKAVLLGEYEARLARLVKQLGEAGLPVVLSTVVSNAFFPSVHWECPEKLEALGLRPSRTAILPLSGLDPTAVDAARSEAPCRDLDQLAARLSWEGEREAAVELLEALRDSDPKPLRAPRAVNDAVRRVARGSGADGTVLVDTAAAWKQAGGGVEPPGWFRNP